ncbi:MAG: kynureninase [Candidatus Marinimicrobia bacterium]|nr:kynureninase [Candidatus Neomarinimicrobiota bacterium]MBT3675815.1 kynureninase [Candidatus Neomarinimicrobiota bacterium]MBT3762977.1 kynureninase [Candidatus Neomarinimicrobiota bacterium]MBT4069124.1 kynureninase [Candidatus Neomarinimicrobiota bacterium]MBT4271510.1 kynureninase [Candidatus Neomarinimicrobiota bacterium]
MGELFSKDYANQLDENNPLKYIRDRFHLPKKDGKPVLYFSGNSLGLQPKGVSNSLLEEANNWAKKGADGYFSDWINFHERFLGHFEPIIGGQSHEFMVMNALTVNLHLLMVSFYRPTKMKYKIIIEGGAFPSDQYAVKSQIEFHGLDPNDTLIELKPKEGEYCLSTDDILKTIELNGESTALIMLGGVNYYTGQKYDMEIIAEAGKKVGAFVGYDLAHAAGNVSLNMHDWNVDFAAWCNYKYLNCGPGAPSGIFVHEKHHKWEGARFAGWWSNKIDTRFKMDPNLDPIQNAAGWGISNSPIFSMAPLKNGLEIYREVGMSRFVEVSHQLTGYLESIIRSELPQMSIITPNNPSERGCQISMMVENGKSVYEALVNKNIVCDWREPNVLRIAPTPLYNTYSEAFKFVQILKNILN